MEQLRGNYRLLIPHPREDTDHQRGHNAQKSYLGAIHQIFKWRGWAGTAKSKTHWEDVMLLQANLLLETQWSCWWLRNSKQACVISQFCLKETQTRSSKRTDKLLLRNTSIVYLVLLQFRWAEKHLLILRRNLRINQQKDIFFKLKDLWWKTNH